MAKLRLYASKAGSTGLRLAQSWLPRLRSTVGGLHASTPLNNPFPRSLDLTAHSLVSLEVEAGAQRQLRQLSCTKFLCPLIGFLHSRQKESQNDVPALRRGRPRNALIILRSFPHRARASKQANCGAHSFRLQLGKIHEVQDYLNSKTAGNRT